MAAIDKTYAHTWEEYVSLVEWAKNTKFICSNGMVLYPMEYIYEWYKELYDEAYKSFKEKYPDSEFEFPVMNTSNVLDYFIIKECPLKFVQNRMKEVYSSEYIQSVLHGTSAYDTYKREPIGTKVKVIKYPKFGNRSKLCEKKRGMKFITVLEPKMRYNAEYDYWLSDNELGWYNCSICNKNINSTKAMIRQIRKWKLPKGTKVSWCGRYIGNEFIFVVL